MHPGKSRVDPPKARGAKKRIKERYKPSIESRPGDENVINQVLDRSPRA